LRALIALALAAAAALPAAAQAAKDRHPDLWATINVCDPPQRPGAVGVRLSIPRERGAPRQWARIRMQFFDPAHHAWKRVRSGGDTGFARLGKGTRTVAGGTTFTFNVPAAGTPGMILRGLVDVEWRRRTKVVDHARLVTEGGHEDRKDRALRQSLKTCTLKR
jgi:hypothetical protein